MTRPAIVAAGAADIDRLAEMQAMCFHESWGAASIAKTLSLPGTFALFIKDTTPVGRLSVGFALLQVASDQGDILTLGVIPGLRRRGYARLLLDGATARAAELGAKTLFLEVAEDNAAGLGLYLAAGFETIGRRQGYYRDPLGRKVAAITMRRII